MQSSDGSDAATSQGNMIGINGVRVLEYRHVITFHGEDKEEWALRRRCRSSDQEGDRVVIALEKEPSKMFCRS